MSVERVRKELREFIEKAMRQLTLRVWQTLTVETPVLTGFARAGWTPAEGSPKLGESSPASTVQALAKAQAAALFAKNSQAAVAISKGYRLRTGPVFIVNNVKYLRKLNEGSSAQAPAHFVETAVKQGLRATQKALRRSG